MCQLPRTQPESAALAKSMLAGFAEHPATFPSADPAKLSEALENYYQARESFNSAASAYKQAGSIQKKAFARLKSIISSQIKAAQVDTADDPKRLGFIGSGPRKKKTPVDLPGQPQLDAVEPMAEGAVRLKWRSSRSRSRGPARSFNIESRAMDNAGVSNWHLVGTSFDCEAVLKDQPVGVKLEYRVTAANNTGQSFPSNTMAVIL